MSLLVELGNRRPKRAGKAVIEYDDGGRSLDTYPRRDGDTIILPGRGDLQLYKLQKDWNQFIARFDWSTIWFGGTDENPFLVRIDDTPFSQYCRYGPKGFYESLVPSLPEKTCRRQGDIFACPIPFTWEEILKVYRYMHGWIVEVEESKVDEHGGGLFGTRHSLDGVTLNHTVHIPGGSDADFRSRDTWLTLAEGTVVAPDHTDMKLVGVHALAQTLHLADSRNAD